MPCFWNYREFQKRGVRPGRGRHRGSNKTVGRTGGYVGNRTELLPLSHIFVLSRLLPDIEDCNHD
jgi:hypothetical protein